MLQQLPALEQRVVHIVRDSRGVAYSRRKQVRWTDAVDGSRFMLMRPALRTGVGWTAKNLLCATLRPPVRPVLRLRYERFAADPAGALDRLARWLGREVPEVTRRRLADGLLEPGTHHTVAGNPVRMYRGALPIAVDEEWRRALPRRDRAAVAAVTWPLLLAYGYLPARRGRRAPQAPASGAAVES